MRGGVPVRKSKLVPDPRMSKRVQLFLRMRADGARRFSAAQEAKLGDKVQASLIAIERNALTYAGYTVWNQRKKQRPTREDKRKTMTWRKREDWIMSPEPTHEALITREEAERILALTDRESPKAARGLTPRKPEDFLLTGFLMTPDGKAWHADGKFYRLGKGSEFYARRSMHSCWNTFKRKSGARSTWLSWCVRHMNWPATLT